MTNLESKFPAGRRSRVAILAAALLDGVAIADAPRAGVTILRAWTRPATASRPAGVVISEVRPGAPRGTFYAVPLTIANGWNAERARKHALRVHCVRFGLSLDHMAAADGTVTYAAARPDAIARAGVYPLPPRRPLDSTAKAIAA